MSCFLLATLAAGILTGSSGFSAQASSVVDAEAHIPCGPFRTCSGRDRLVWQAKRRLLDEILRAKNASALGPFISRTDPMIAAISQRSSLCSDESLALLGYNEADTWPLACVWSGNNVSGSCVPAPILSTFFVPAGEWSSKLKEFRRLIGCSSSDVEMAGKVKEFYVCRRDCMHIGFAYADQIVLTFGLISFLMAIVMMDP